MEITTYRIELSLEDSSYLCVSYIDTTEEDRIKYKELYDLNRLSSYIMTLGVDLDSDKSNISIVQDYFDKEGVIQFKKMLNEYKQS
jgi:hypothetical protein